MKVFTHCNFLLSALVSIFLTGVISAQNYSQSSSFRITINTPVPMLPQTPLPPFHNCGRNNQEIPHSYDSEYETYETTDNTEAHTVCSQNTMAYAFFEISKARVRQELIESNRINLMKQEVYGKRITVYQVREYLGLLAIDRNRLEMAKYFFDYTCNRSRYYTINEMLLATSVQELNQYLRGRDMSDDASGTIYDSGNYSENSENENQNDGSVVIVPADPNQNGNPEENSPVVIIPGDPNDSGYNENENGSGTVVIVPADPNSSSGGYNNEEYNNDNNQNGGYNNSNYHQNNSSYQNGYCYDAICAGDFADIKEAISHATFSDAKKQIMEQALEDRCVNTTQVKEILGMFTFDSDKVEAAKFLYPRTIDKRNYYKVNSAFTFSGSVDELNQFVKGCK